MRVLHSHAALGHSPAPLINSLATARCLRDERSVISFLFECGFACTSRFPPAVSVCACVSAVRLRRYQTRDVLTAAVVNQLVDSVTREHTAMKKARWHTLSEQAEEFESWEAVTS